MIRNAKVYLLAISCIAISACSSSKGSSYLKSSSDSSSSQSVVTPKVKASVDTQTTSSATTTTNDELESRISELKETIESAKAQVADTIETKAQEVEQLTVTVKEEKVSIIESADTQRSGKYHIIIGSFKQLENARTLSNNAIKQGFLPSIMENEEGMYRVAVFTGDEASARSKLSEMRTTHAEYVGMWLLIEK